MNVGQVSKILREYLPVIDANDAARAVIRLLEGEHGYSREPYIHEHDMGGGLYVCVEDTGNVVLHQRFIDGTPPVIILPNIDDLCSTMQTARIEAKVYLERLEAERALQRTLYVRAERERESRDR